MVWSRRERCLRTETCTCSTLPDAITWWSSSFASASLDFLGSASKGDPTFVFAIEYYLKSQRIVAEHIFERVKIIIKCMKWGQIIVLHSAFLQCQLAAGVLFCSHYLKRASSIRSIEKLRTTVAFCGRMRSKSSITSFVNVLFKGCRDTPKGARPLFRAVLYRVIFVPGYIAKETISLSKFPCLCLLWYVLQVRPPSLSRTLDSMNIYYVWYA